MNARTDAQLILAPISAEMQSMDQVIRARLASEVPLVNQIAEYIIGAGGKRLRPALLLLFAGAGGYQGEHHLTLAATVEFIHTATLLHDDVVDESSLRRGRATANALFGNAASVLVGDFLYSRAFQMMVGVESMAVMKVVADATNVIAEGEVLQLLNIHDAEIDEARYLQVIRYKTAQLFEASARLAGILCKSGVSIEEEWGAFGRHLGTAFQLIDDVLDYSGVADEIGKNVGDDLRQGKATLPLIYLLKHGSATQQALIRGAIVNPEDADLSAIQTEILVGGALDYTRDKARHEAAQARAIAQRLEDSPHKDSLLELCSFAVSRDH